MTISTSTTPPPPPSIDPVLHSSLTSVGLAAASAIAAWAATKASLTPDQQQQVASVLFTVGGTAGAIGIGWWKARRNTQEALIKTVNAAPNGVTVVATKDAVAAGIPPVEVPVINPKPYSP